MTAAERARWRERMERLAVAEQLGDGTDEDRERAVGEADRWRAGHGYEPLPEWWAEKTEHLLHERARALGLLSPFR